MELSTPARFFGAFGGRFMPEALIATLDELEVAWRAAMADPAADARALLLNRQEEQRLLEREARRAQQLFDRGLRRDEQALGGTPVDERHGRHVHYSLHDEHVAELLTQSLRHQRHG